MNRRVGAIVLFALPLAGCGLPAALDPASPTADRIASLIWLFVGIAAAIWLAVLVTTLLTLARADGPLRDPLALDPRRERRAGGIVAALGIATLVIVGGLTLLSYFAQEDVFAGPPPAVTVEVIGHQWWWELRYVNADPSRTIVTANELHVPLGQPVSLELGSADVIHSFWVPSLMGKADLVPGRSNRLRFTATKPGVYLGSCAEFCGLQHAHMGIRVFVETPAAFAAWSDAQVRSAMPPATPAAKEGQQVFLSNPCVSCHTVRGAGAGGTLGPDLTHLASRSTLAAGTVPLTRGSLAAWIVDPHGLKPGTVMPTIPLDPSELDPLLDFLMGLT